MDEASISYINLNEVVDSCNDLASVGYSFKFVKVDIKSALDFSSDLISNILNFSTQSYFIKVFKKYTGTTPNEYKKKYNFFGNNLLEAMQNKNSSSS